MVGVGSQVSQYVEVSFLSAIQSPQTQQATKP